MESYLPFARKLGLDEKILAEALEDTIKNDIRKTCLSCGRSRASTRKNQETVEKLNRLALRARTCILGHWHDKNSIKPCKFYLPLQI